MKPFEPLTHIDAVHAFIRQHRLAFLYIQSEDCNVCHALLPQVQNILNSYPDIRLGLIDAQEVRQVAAAFAVFTVPALLLFVDGLVYLREARIVHTGRFAEHVQRIYTYAKEEH